MTPQEKIQPEIQRTVNQIKDTLQDIKKVALSEAWKILQVLVAKIITSIEYAANDWSGPEKKQLAMDLLSDAYDKLFSVIDIPGIPSFLEGYLHKYVKSLLMILLSSAIDAMVATFRDIGIFISKKNNESLEIIKPTGV